MKIKQLSTTFGSNFPWILGCATYVPWAFAAAEKKMRKVPSARICYSIWLRHLVKACEQGLSTHAIVVAELGPGEYLGTELAALLSGASKYFALEIQEPDNPNKNIEIFDELINLFKKREKIPNDAELNWLIPRLKSYEFPHHILTDTRLSEALRKDRLKEIKHSLLNITKGETDCDNQHFSYIAPWTETSIKPESIDMILSQSVMEHVNDLDYAYRALSRWLKPNGFMSHAIDFSCHATSRYWNGHWAYSDFAWRLITGRRKWLISRQPYSKHYDLINKHNSEIVSVIKYKRTDGIHRKKLAPNFKKIFLC